VITATVPKGVCIQENIYLVAMTDAGIYQIVNPDLVFHGQCVTTTVGSASTFITLKIYKGAQGAETYTGVDIAGSWSPLVRRGVIFANKTYVIDSTDNGYEVRPSIAGKGQTSAAHNKGANGTIKIFTGAGNGADSGVTLTAWNAFANLAINKNVEWIYSDDSNEFRLISGEC
jgi:hypothetical protein